MGGTTSSVRRHNDGKGYEGRLHLKGMMAYWGDALLYFPQAAKGIHAKKNITVRIKKGRSFVLKPEHILAFELAAVSYNGSGKYAGQTLVEFADIADDDIATIEEEFKDLPGPSEDDGFKNKWTKELCPYPSEGNTWWPVTTVKLTVEAKKEMKTQAHWEGGRIIICWYQWLENPLEGWVIPL
jgi:hypothetical protein